MRHADRRRPDVRAAEETLHAIPHPRSPTGTAKSDLRRDSPRSRYSVVGAEVQRQGPCAGADNATAPERNASGVLLQKRLRSEQRLLHFFSQPATLEDRIRIVVPEVLEKRRHVILHQAHAYS